jgi:alpha-glucoside transport system permease protein
VKVTTNGQFDSQVLANDMFQEAFSFTNTGKGAALAMLIFISVLPIMIGNIRRMQREA